MNDDLRLVYGWVKGSRERVFSWLETLPPELYTLERPDFAHGSLRNIQAHIADCYLRWVGLHGLELERYGSWINARTLTDMAAMRTQFREVDDVLEAAFERFTDLDAPRDILFGRQQTPLRVTRRWLVLHPITHEFHHKGQMLALGRVLGHPYPPGPDTDLLLPFET